MSKRTNKHYSTFKHYSIMEKMEQVMSSKAVKAFNFIKCLDFNRLCSIVKNLDVADDYFTIAEKIVSLKLPRTADIQKVKEVA